MKFPFRIILISISLSTLLFHGSSAQILPFPNYRGNIQSNQTENENPGLTDPEFRPTEFAIPTAPAFSLLNADPSLVSMPGVVREFKVDWSMRTYKLSPNLSLEANPIWSFFYDRPGYHAYQKAGKFMQRLSSLNLSIGTIQFDTTRQVAFAIKLNLYSQKDYYANKELGEAAFLDIKPFRDSIQSQIDRLITKLNYTKSDAEKVMIDYQIMQLEQQMASYDQQLKDRSNMIRSTYMRRFWNSTVLDVCFGKSYTYFSERIDSLKLKNEGIGIWFTGGFGMGKHTFITGMVKYIQFSATNHSWQNGLNFRYGGLRYHFYTEFVSEMNKTEKTDLVSGEKQLLDNRVITIGYGGAFRIGSNLLLSFGIRTIYDRHMKFNSLLPIANLSCLMR